LSAADRIELEERVVPAARARKGAATSAPTEARPRYRGLTLIVRAALIRVVVVVAVIILWDVSTRFGWIDKLFVSSPGDVGGAVVQLAGQGIVWDALRETGSAILIAFVCGTLAGIVAGMLLGLVKLLRDAYFGIVLFLLSTPKSIFVPIFLLLFGIGPTAAAVFGAFEAFFYVTVSVVGGVGLVEERHLRIATAFRASWWHRFTDVILPAASPGVFTGLWFGIKHAFLGVLIVELYVSVGGLGQLIRNYTNDLATNKVLALIGEVVVAAVLLGTLWTRVERRMSRWRSDGGGTITGSVTS
jgi:ABC-type nitrate/sulfonate/bicarbonate transport system permease component